METLEKKDTKFMGVINVTPDSFSDGGRFVYADSQKVEKIDIEKILEVAREMIEDGAGVLDIGGESTGPGSTDVDVNLEMERVVPVISRLRKAFPKVVISVDTWKSEVAEAALRAGANMVNDVTAGRGDPRIFEVVAVASRRLGQKVLGMSGVPMVLMYSKDAGPRTTREPVKYKDVIATIKLFLRERVAAARAAGVKSIIIDPGMGAFISGIPDYSFEVISRILELRELGCPILVGTSRKSFLGAGGSGVSNGVGNDDVEDREIMTLWTTTVLCGKVDFLRVHSVIENVTAICV